MLSNGRPQRISTPRPLLDMHSRVFAVLVGRPKDGAAWAQVHVEAQDAFELACRMHNTNSAAQPPSHRRGVYSAMSSGILYGGGQKYVGNLTQNLRDRYITSRLLNNPSIKRLAGFSHTAFKLFAPRMYKYYAETMNTVCEDNPELRRNFENGVFGCATFNLGPQVVTYPHTDHLNLPAGWCAATSIGQFNHTDGGHLLLWDLKLMIEFPAGSLVLIPSAVLQHSNTTIGHDETRYSFTQYSAGGLFRWVECDCKSQKQFTAEGGVYGVSGVEWWLRGVDMWSTWEELQATA
ncbi:hypothetical protein C8Q79DRAFT_913492 [Trametes meyenii]|nr:hypothetical protein C8Q79DRAFT_913492 [Trametes meyenii]